MTGAVGPFRQPSGYVNGNTLDRERRLISCEHGTRRGTRVEHDGSVTVLADRWQGKRTASGWTRTDGSGRLPARRSTATTRSGTLLCRLILPENASNLVFGGLKRNRVFITATTSLYSMMVNFRVAPPVWTSNR